MSLLSNLRILYHLTLAPNRGDTHQARLEQFYAGQAGEYDSFRKKLLHGREELYRGIPVSEGDRWADIGGGTAANVESICSYNLFKLDSLDVVDLSPSLLKIATNRIAERGWRNVHTVEADAVTWTPPYRTLDIITFSYSLSMIPDALGALENAWRLLKPGGLIGVVDFHVSHKHPADGLVKHPWSTRTFWKLWFEMDNVFLSHEPLMFLKRKFETLRLEERRAKLPWLPWVRAPYFSFLGKKRV